MNMRIKIVFYTINYIISFLYRNGQDFYLLKGIKLYLDMEVFAERLKELRTEKWLSIQALAKEVGIGSSCLCRWENCQADVKGSQLIVLAKYFGVSVDYLLGLEV